jgi:SAM-dependent methyltransferase
MEQTDSAFVERVFHLVLRRTPDEDGLSSALERLEAGTLSRAGLVAELVASIEFARLRALDDAVAFAVWARAANERPRDLRGPPGSDERVIEIPWVLSRYRGEARALDVGSTHAPAAYLDALTAAVPGRPVALDLAPAELDGFECVVGDLRALPFGDHSFDIAFCISTLEHVGADNALYGVAGDRDEGGIGQALRELVRVLDRGGRLLATVPCGAPEEHGWFVQHDEAGWLDLFASAGLHVEEHELYALDEQGWRSTDSLEAGYGTVGAAASGVLCAELHPGRRRHAAQRALRRSAGRYR